MLLDFGAMLWPRDWDRPPFLTGAKNIILSDKRPLPKEDGYIAPTWSPASFAKRSSHGMPQDGRVEIAVVTGFSVTPKNTQNPFGEVVDGWISLRAPLVRRELSELPEVDEANLPDRWFRHMRLCTPLGNPYGVCSLFDGIRGQTEETRSWVKENEIFALVLSNHLEANTESFAFVVSAYRKGPINPSFLRVSDTGLDP
uniref:WGS project CBMI000000000 data, contig CS3069_c004264 n=1 Tax=Fusarium clavum TaxID=2594811 RepID=A0A090MII8_9HYPO|nr:unnamed protein product [Fusarium clavum]CEG05958.1 unnamed protein product [Fusarium clavum]